MKISKISRGVLFIFFGCFSFLTVVIATRSLFQNQNLDSFDFWSGSYGITLLLTGAIYSLNIRNKKLSDREKVKKELLKQQELKNLDIKSPQIIAGIFLFLTQDFQRFFYFF